MRGGFLTRQGREGFECIAKALGPAPPWHAGRLRQEICSDCERPCVQACEMDIIRIHGSEHGLAGTPYLSFDQGGCTFCQACLDVCPMDLGAPAQTQVRVGTAVLDAATCLAWAGVVCMSCRFSCTWRAIALDTHNRPSIDAEICTGCGLCVGVCPKQAIAVEVSQ
ncbi:MAG: 4Fe-4S dicluster domain-containing protein [Gammaproteobacteria bacterium]|nr:4Fe-4S dicluster domain-containing protein [Gammaproteobacteria bacterium]